MRPAPRGGLLEVRKRVQSPPQRDAFGCGVGQDFSVGEDRLGLRGFKRSKAENSV